MPQSRTNEKECVAGTVGSSDGDDSPAHVEETATRHTATAPVTEQEASVEDAAVTGTRSRTTGQGTGGSPTRGDEINTRVHDPTDEEAALVTDAAEKVGRSRVLADGTGRSPSQKTEIKQTDEHGPYHEQAAARAIDAVMMGARHMMTGGFPIREVDTTKEDVQRDTVGRRVPNSVNAKQDEADKDDHPPSSRQPRVTGETDGRSGNILPKKAKEEVGGGSAGIQPEVADAQAHVLVTVQPEVTDQANRGFEVIDQEGYESYGFVPGTCEIPPEAAKTASTVRSKKDTKPAAAANETPATEDEPSLGWAGADGGTTSPESELVNN